MTEVKDSELVTDLEVEVEQETVVEEPEVGQEEAVPEVVIPEVDYSLPDIEEMRSASEKHKFDLLNRIMDDIRHTIENGAANGESIVVTNWFPTVRETDQLAIHNDRLYPQELAKIVRSLEQAKYKVEVENHSHTTEKDMYLGSMRRDTRLKITIF